MNVLPEPQILFTVNIGTKDKELYKEICDSDKIRRIISYVCKGYHVSYVLRFQRGGYMHENGTFVEEDSVAIALMGVSEEIVREIAADTCAFFRQETVLIEKQYVEIYRIKDPGEDIMNSSTSLSGASYTIYLAAKDKDIYQKTCDSDIMKRIISHVCRGYHVSYSLWPQRSGTVSDNGEFTEEDSIAIKLLGIDEKTALEIAEDLCVFLKQKEILIEKHAVETYLIQQSLDIDV